MKQNANQPLFAEERKELILQRLMKNTKVLVPELCDVFAVSSATIRNDLRDLEHDGKLKRTHGGAIPAEKAAFEPDASVKEVKHQAQKKCIAKFAAGFIEDGDTIALDTGTTLQELAKCLADKKDLTVVLNDIVIADYLETHTDANVILLGGSLRRGFHCMVGPMTVKMLRSLNVDKAFLATNAFSLEKGFTTPDLNQAEVKKAMIDIASEVFVLCDSSKIGRVSFRKFADLKEVDKLVVDAGARHDVSEILEEAREQTQLLVVESNES